MSRKTHLDVDASLGVLFQNAALHALELLFEFGRSGGGNGEVRVWLFDTLHPVTHNRIVVVCLFITIKL